LREGVDQKEHVKKELELAVEYFGDEGEEVVLGVFDDVVLVVEGLYLSAEEDDPLAVLHIFAAVLFEPFEMGGRRGLIFLDLLLEEMFFEFG